MADTFTHGAATGWTAKLLGLLFYLLFGIEPFDPNWLLFAVLGATLLDVCTDPICWIARHLRFGSGRSPLVSMKYDALLTKELAVLEKESSRAVIWYHIVHTYWTAGITTVLVLVLFGPYLATGWAAGYFPHVALDEGTHRKLAPFLPFEVRCFRTETNWWEWKWTFEFAGKQRVVAWSPHLYFVSIPVALAGIFHLCQLHNVI